MTSSAGRSGPAGLRVLTVNHADVGAGGAALAGYRLHRGLRGAGVDAEMIVGRKSSHDDSVRQLRAWRTLRRPAKRVLGRAGLNELDGISAYGLGRRDEFQRADVVHYHAIHGDYFSYPVMASLTARKPSVLTLHDMWPFTGHCSFSFECTRFQTGCGQCPHLDAFPAVERDSTRVEWKLKNATWARSRITVVSPSHWLADEARKSMLGHFDIEVIPHGIDTTVFEPVERGAARAALRLPGDRPILLYGAAYVADRRKGPDLLLDALARLPRQLAAEVTVALMGHWGQSLAPRVRAAGCEAVDFGFIESDRLKAVLYSAADLFVFPSRADNSPLTVLESLACGTPVVAFDVGGVPEMVRDGRNGRLVGAEDASGLGAAIAELLADPGSRARLGSEARALVCAENQEALAVRRHLELYESLTERAR
jgi:glycosyltransferase involved in cell wall biosynthesis